MDNWVIRIARPEDAEALLEIYRPYVERTAVSFECAAPSVEEFRGRIERTLEKISLFAGRVWRGNSGLCLRRGP